MLFGLSAFASLAPKNGMSFIRSLIVIASATLIAVFATQPRIRRKTVDPDAWLETAIPIAVALIATLAILIYNRRSTPQKGDDELNIDL
jgi:UDP-N-acetylmuramyl pentapeptide phosphotransferase/UDP-N-acetylglucosamine-1-phosphate transferase